MSPNEAIIQFSKRANLSELHQALLLKNYHEQLESQIAKHRSERNRKPTASVEQSYRDTILSDANLTAQARVATDTIDSIVEKRVKSKLRPYRLREFAYSTLASILGAALFSAFLLLVVTLAQQEAKSLIRDLFQESDAIEDSIK